MPSISEMDPTTKELLDLAAKCADKVAAVCLRNIAHYNTLLAYTQEPETAAAVRADIADEHAKFNARMAELRG